ncbi:hypothetical protein EKG40_32165, partial [Pseudomonas moorei]
MERRKSLTPKILSFVAMAGWLAAATAAHAQSAPGASGGDQSEGQDASALAKKIQNPIGDLYSFPFQSNT